jgi:hypothetical protein
MNNTIHTEVKRTVIDLVPFTVEEFTQKLQRFQPTHIFNVQYSDKKPVYIITEYAETHLMLYGDSWANQEPRKFTYEAFYNRLAVSGIANVLLANSGSANATIEELEEKKKKLEHLIATEMTAASRYAEDDLANVVKQLKMWKKWQIPYDE